MTHCKALCDFILSQIERNGPKFSHIELTIASSFIFSNSVPAVPSLLKREERGRGRRVGEGGEGQGEEGGRGRRSAGANIENSPATQTRKKMDQHNQAV